MSLIHGITNALVEFASDISKWRIENTLPLIIGGCVIILLIFLLSLRIVKFPSDEERKSYRGRVRTNRIIYLATVIPVIFLLALAMSRPYVQSEKSVTGDTSVTILLDNSLSMKVLNYPQVNRMIANLSNMTKTRVVSFGGGYTAIGDALLASARGKDNILVISDGFNNRGKSVIDVLDFLKMINSSVNAVAPLVEDDELSVSLEGPSSVIEETPNEFRVRIRSAKDEEETGRTGGEYELVVKVDGNVVLREKHRGYFSRLLTLNLAMGYHRIEADINAVDLYNANNKAFKTVVGLPKPKVLLVSSDNDKSRLESLLSRVFDVERMNTIPDLAKLNEYEALILDDTPVAEIDKWEESISSYVEDGNGLFVVGGRKSFDEDYKNSLIETILPVKALEGNKETEDKVNIVIVVDISGSTGDRFSKSSTSRALEVEKSLAIEIMKGLRRDDYVGCVAFNNKAYEVAPIAKMKEQLNLEDRIASLQNSGGTDIGAGLSKAAEMLRGRQGSRYVILISDGRDTRPRKSYNIARAMSDIGIKIYSVGVGKRTDTEFMRNIASIGTGVYFQPTETQKIELLLGAPPENDTMRLVVVDSNHFITRNINLTAKLNGYNRVKEKNAARKLVITADKNPVLVTWRYGLGRIAVFTGDNGRLWSGPLFTTNNADLFLRTVRWLVGSISTDKIPIIIGKELYAGERGQIFYYTSNPRNISGFDFFKESDSVYSSEHKWDSPGFKDVGGAVVAVNYPRELERFGRNADFFNSIKSEGGQVFSPLDVKGVFERIKKDSTSTVIKKRYDYVPIYLLAGIFYLIYVAVRVFKMRE